MFLIFICNHIVPIGETIFLFLKYYRYIQAPYALLTVDQETNI